MVQFNDEEGQKRLQERRKEEEEELAQMLSEKYGVQYQDLSMVSINTNALQLIDEERARRAEAAAFARTGDSVHLAVRSPNADEVKQLVDDLEERGFDITLYMVSQESLKRAWDYYSDIQSTVSSESGVMDISEERVSKLMQQVTGLREAKDYINGELEGNDQYRISRFIEATLASGIAIEASDIHFEPEEEYVRLRFRLDGVLQDVLEFDRETYDLLRSRIKLVSGLYLNITDEAQDGRFSIRIDQKDIEVRTSVLPDAYGESIVMRLLDPSTIGLPMEELGIEDYLFSILEEQINQPNGMILTTGPTGSGKTTALYAFLKRIHEPEIKIVTIEDPVEYHLPGIVQTQASEDYTFAQALRSTLRQDPDVIMVGEIRDPEVAETGVNAALTGHLVFSTLHTNNAAGTFPRLIDLDVNPKIIGSAVNLAMAQRLIRRLCNECKEKVELDGTDKRHVDEILESIERDDVIPDNTTEVYRAVGCKECGDTGYSGRIGIFEAILMDEKIEQLVQEKPSEREINEAARPQGILSMRQDGLLKVLEGISSLDELERVVGLAGEYHDNVSEDDPTEEVHGPDA
jgi:type IV pilus assembly protein PilB